ncbi:hypothetical protein HN011_002589 [Eciton burchellii]|nr:hypothetical protein HN011_002589 [Eciton burchellii]
MYVRCLSESLVRVQCRQFDPVSGPFSMNNERNGSVYSIGSQNHLVPVKSKRTFLKKRIQISKLVIIILFLLLGSLFMAVIVFTIFYTRVDTMKICDSEDCVRIAASLKGSMNTSVDPCDDFYQYACGRWSQEHPIPDSSFVNSWLREGNTRVSRKIRDLLKADVSAKVPWAVMQAKTLYASCIDVHAMNELGLSSLYGLLELLNIPAIPAAFTNITSNYIEQIARVKRILGQDIFFGFEIMPDLKNRSKNVMVLYPSELDSPFPRDKELEKRLRIMKSRFRKLEDPDAEVTLSEDEEIELTYITDVINQVISNGTANACNNESIVPEEELTELVNMLYSMSNYINYKVVVDGNLTIYEDIFSDDDYMLVDDLQKLTDEYVISVNSTYMPKPIWRPFIEYVFDSIATLDLDKDKVLIGNLKYLKDIALILANIEEQELESYVWWSVINVAAPHSSEKLRITWTTYINKLRNSLDIEIEESKSLQCASAVNELMGMAVSWLFVDPTFHNNEAPKVREMLENIKEAFTSLVVEADWMDRSTRAATLEKNRKMSSKIGFPKWLFNEDELNRYYEGIDLSETKYLENMIQIIQSQMNETWAAIRKNNTFNDSYWLTDPTNVNAYHISHANEITIPFGILQFPFYQLGLEALNYGAIGSILGHELSHGFDNSGRLYDSDGNLQQWWTNESITEYTQRAQCFIDHYNTYYEAETGDYVDGEETLDENIADNVGLREAVIAYERWKTRHGQEPLLPGFTQFTHEQLLYLAFAHVWCESYTVASLKWLLADTHSPPHVRLRAVLKNSKEFSAAWDCPVESNMNPSKKCHLW